MGAHAPYLFKINGYTLTPPGSNCDIEQRKSMLVLHMLQIGLVLWLIVNCKGHNNGYIATI